MATLLALAVAADREAGLVRERRKEIEQVRRDINSPSVMLCFEHSRITSARGIARKSETFILLCFAMLPSCEKV